MAKERQGFIIYHDIKQAVDGLSKEQCGELFLALLNYSIDGTRLQMEKLTEFAFKILKARIDADKEKYESKCKQMQANASKRYESVQTLPTKLNETKLNETKLNEKENSLTTIKESESSSFLSVFLDLYDIKSDISSLTQIRDLDFKAILKAYGESKWLKDEIKSLRWVVNNYQKIIKGEYKDKPKAEVKPKEEKLNLNGEDFLPTRPQPNRLLTKEEQEEVKRQLAEMDRLEEEERKAEEERKLKALHEQWRKEGLWFGD